MADELQRLINPFILRRTKEKVATELPDKIEDVIYCDMSNKQRKVYEGFLKQIRGTLQGHIEQNGYNQSKLMVLQALTKLRQICNSPALLSDEEDFGGESIKLHILTDHIKEKTGNHQILVFLNL